MKIYFFAAYLKRASLYSFQMVVEKTYAAMLMMPSVGIALKSSAYYNCLVVKNEEVMAYARIYEDRWVELVPPSYFNYLSYNYSKVAAQLSFLSCRHLIMLY